MSWNSDEIEKLGRLASEGSSAAQIAREIGVTRNAVIGKVHRLGIKLNGGPGGTAAGAPKARASNPMNVPRVRPAGAGRNGMAGKWQRLKKLPRPARVHFEGSDKRIPRAVPMPSALEGFPGVTIPDLRDEICHWPNGDPADLAEFRYCGAPVSGGRSYCPYHHAIAYVTIARDTREREAKTCLAMA